MKGNAKVGSETRFSRKVLVNVTCSVVDFFFPFSPVSLTEECSFWYGLKDPCISPGTTLSLAVKTDDVTSRRRNLDLHGRFSGGLVKSIIPRLKATSGHLF